MAGSRKRPRGDYAVGYCRPPKAQQFPKGVSGNPKGRPKGTKNLKTDLMEELGESMTLRENGRTRRVSKQRALIKTQVARAIQGNDRAAAKVLDLLLRIAGLDPDTAPDLPLSEDEQAVLETLRNRVLRDACGSGPEADRADPDDPDGPEGSSGPDGPSDSDDPGGSDESGGGP